MNPHQNMIRDIVTNLNLCECGMNHWKTIKDLLEVAEHRGGFTTPQQNLLAKFLQAAGLLDHDSDITSAWLSIDGQILLKFLRDYDTLPEWVYEEIAA